MWAPDKDDDLFGVHINKKALGVIAARPQKHRIVLSLSHKYAFEHLVGISVPPLKIDILYYRPSGHVNRKIRKFPAFSK